MKRDSTKKCVEKKQRTLRIKLKTVAFALKLRQLNKKQIVGILMEFAERFCERNSEATRCDKLLEPLKESLRCRAKRNITEDTIEIDVEVSKEGRDSKSKEGRRLLSENDPADLLEDAIKDDTDNVDVLTRTQDDTQDNAGSKTMVSALTALISIMFFFQ
jgi:hypothetical protein